MPRPRMEIPKLTGDPLRNELEQARLEAEIAVEAVRAALRTQSAAMVRMQNAMRLLEAETRENER